MRFIRIFYKCYDLLQLRNDRADWLKGKIVTRSTYSRFNLLVF